MKMKPNVFPGATCLAAALLVGGMLRAAETTDETDPSTVLTPAQWQQVDRSVDRALAWLATQQQPDRSFPSRDSGQPAVSSLCLLAFLSRGHLPGEGQYGDRISRAIDYVLASQRDDGLFSRRPPEPGHVHSSYSHTAMYNHAIAGLMLCEVYGMTADRNEQRMRRAIELALQFTRRMQTEPKRFEVDEGGMRYIRRIEDRDSDLSVTAWHLMFMRSAKNAGFEVPAEWIDEAVAYTHRCFDRRHQTFVYAARGTRPATRAMAGAGILTLSLSGHHDTPMARAAAGWVLQHPLTQYNAKQDRYHYGVYYCTQGMFQLGRDYWQQFFPPLVNTLLSHQNRDGSWDPESADRDSQFGNAYTTALVVLTLNTPNQLLPIFQR